MAKYKLIKRTNPLKKDAPPKWYATPNSESPLSGKAKTRAATANTTLAPIEMEASLELLAKFVPQQLQQGHTVKIPGLGTFRTTFKSDGVENINDFRANSMIKNARIVFTPSKELRESVLNGLEACWKMISATLLWPIIAWRRAPLRKVVAVAKTDQKSNKTQCVTY